MIEGAQGQQGWVWCISSRGTQQLLTTTGHWDGVPGQVWGGHRETPDPSPHGHPPGELWEGAGGAAKKSIPGQSPGHMVLRNGQTALRELPQIPLPPHHRKDTGSHPFPTPCLWEGTCPSLCVVEGSSLSPFRHSPGEHHQRDREDSQSSGGWGAAPGYPWRCLHGGMVCGMHTRDIGWDEREHSQSNGGFTPQCQGAFQPHPWSCCPLG